jgi:hypothetical protein
MFKRKNILVAVAVSMFLAACGGGSDDGAAPAAAGAQATGGNNTQVLDTTTLRGFLRLTANQLQFSNTVITNEQLQTLTAGVGPFATGAAAPLTKFGFRISGVGMDGAANQSATGRMAIDLTERAGSAGIAAGQQAEQFQVMIDKVTLTANAAGAFSVADATGAKAYVRYQPATGTAVNFTVDNAAGLLSLAPVTGDTTSSMLTFDLETAMSRAIAAATGTTKTTLQTAKDISGLFDMKATISNVAIRANDETTVLTGQSVTVAGSNQAAVTGAGVAGAVKVNIE